MQIEIEYWVALTEGDDIFYSGSIDGFGTSALDYEYLVANKDIIGELLHGIKIYDYSEETTVHEVWNQLLEEVDIGGLKEECYIPCFLIDNQIMHITSTEYTVSVFLSQFVNTANVKALFIVSNAAGEAFRDDGLRYYFHSHEAGKHNKPHVHVDYLHEASGTYDILTGERINGDIPSKKDKIIRKKILDNQDELIKWWNYRTDGIKIDINHAFGYRPLIGIDTAGD